MKTEKDTTQESGPIGAHLILEDAVRYRYIRQASRLAFATTLELTEHHMKKRLDEVFELGICIHPENASLVPNEDLERPENEIIKYK